MLQNYGIPNNEITPQFISEFIKQNENLSWRFAMKEWQWNRDQARSMVARSKWAQNKVQIMPLVNQRKSLIQNHQQQKSTFKYPKHKSKKVQAIPGNSAIYIYIYIFFVCAFLKKKMYIFINQNICRIIYYHRGLIKCPYL